MRIWLLFLTGICFANTQYHTFEGISEIYNIRSPKILSRFLPENPVIVEGGSYQGRDTEKLAKKFPVATIYAFEPLSTAFSQLSKVVEPFKNVSIFNVALDQISGTRDFFICHGTEGKSPVFEFHSSLLKPVGSSAVHLLGPIASVPCLSLADFCTEQQIGKIDMLWLSTEGNELQVLKGAKERLNDISLVYARTQFHATRESMTLFKDLKEFMEQNGFVLLSHFFYSSHVHGDALFVNRRKFHE